jgi:hypothetical protein
VFGHFERPLATKREWWFRKASVFVASRRGLYEWVTVVAVSRFRAATDWPGDPAGQVDVLRQEFESSLSY